MHEDEADRLLAEHGEDPVRVRGELAAQFAVLQQRSQLLLTLGTLALTITGFSGPKIAASGALARWAMALGLVLTLAAIVVILASTLSIRWITQIQAASPRQTVAAILDYRDCKTRIYRLELLLLVLGLAAYVTSVVAFLLTGEPG